MKVRGRALSSLIDECGLTRIDFLSLDVEGYEEHVLRGIDFTRHRPTFICVETLEAHHRSAVEQVLLPYYQLVEQLTEMRSCSIARIIELREHQTGCQKTGSSGNSVGF